MNHKEHRRHRRELNPGLHLCGPGRIRSWCPELRSPICYPLHHDSDAIPMTRFIPSPAVRASTQFPSKERNTSTYIACAANTHCTPPMLNGLTETLVPFMPMRRKGPTPIPPHRPSIQRYQSAVRERGGRAASSAASYGQRDGLPERIPATALSANPYENG